MKSGDARVALIGFPSVGKVSDGRCGPGEEGGLSPFKHDYALALWLSSRNGEDAGPRPTPVSS